MPGDIPSNSAQQIRVGLLFLGRRRPGFDADWGASMEGRVRRGLANTEFEIMEPCERVVDDPSLRQALAGFEQSGGETVVALQTTMADARMAPTLSQLWSGPILLWATPENPQGDLVSSCSLVGLHAWASILRQMDHPFEIIYGSPDEEDTLGQLEQAIRIAATCRRLRGARVGLVGGQAPGFFAMSADPFDVHRGLGAQVQTFSLTEFADVLNRFSEEEVASDVSRVKATGLQHRDTTDDDLPMASRLYLAMRHYMDEEACGALAVRCWPEMPNTFGQWPYLGMARLAEEGRAIACEGDIDGALNALIGESLGMGPCYLSDWLEHDAETITLWHGGTAPWSLCPAPGEPGGPRIARHFNSGKPAVVEAVIRPNLPVTICRFWRCEGQYRGMACEAETLRPRRDLRGTQALVRVYGRNPREWFVELCHDGMPHHVGVFAGHHEDLLRRFARCAGIEWCSGVG